MSALLGGIGLITGIIGKKKEANAQAKAAAADAEVAKQNAELVGQQIKDAVYRGTRTTRDIFVEGKKVAGQQRAAMGANNLDLTFGSPLDLIYSTQIDAMRDAETAKQNTANEILDLERERVNYTSQAANATATSKYAKSAGTISALSGAASDAARLVAPGGAWASIV